jgi:hypothetical protein
MLDGHGQAVEHEPGAQMIRHGPSDHPPAIGIDHDRQVEEALPGGQVGDVSDPEPVGRGGGEGALDEVIRDEAGLVWPCPSWLPAAAHAHEPGCTHEPGHPFAPTAERVEVEQLGVDRGTP